VIKILDAQFAIAPDQVVPAFEAAMTFYHHVRDHDFFEGTFPKNLQAAADLDAFFDSLGYMLGKTAEGGIDYIDTYGEVPYRGDEYLFAALAPYIEAGSFINIQLDLGVYRWEFDGHFLMEFKGEIYYLNHLIVAPDDFTKVSLDKEQPHDFLRLPEFEDATELE
jgi:hypothetical protein